MSAWITSKAHIDALVTTARLGPTDAKDPSEPAPWPDGLSADQLGQMLTSEMVASVSYRYPHDAPDSLPGPDDLWFQQPYRYQPTRRLTVAEAHRAAFCYEYQSCEHPAWKDSDASAFYAALLIWLLRIAPATYVNRYGDELPVGWEDAPWGLDEADVRSPQAA